MNCLPACRRRLRPWFSNASRRGAEAAANAVIPPRSRNSGPCAEPRRQKQRDQVTGVIDHFRQGEATFLTPRLEQVRELQPDTYIDITHESLIRQWKKLRDVWLPEERDSANTFQYLVKRAGREKLTGLGLAEAVEWDRKRNKTAKWAAHYADEAALGTVLKFVKASEEEERRRARRAKRNLWIAMGLAILFAALGGAALFQWNQARKLSRISLVRQLAAQSELLLSEERVDLEPAALLATESMLRLPGFENDHALRLATSLLPRQAARLNHQGPVTSGGVQSGWAYVATGSGDKSARVFDAASGKQVSRLDHEGAVHGGGVQSGWAAWPPAARTTSARVFDAASGKQVLAPGPPRVGAWRWRSARMGARVATGERGRQRAGVRRGDRRPGLPPGPPRRVLAVAFSPEGHVATGSERRQRAGVRRGDRRQVSRLDHRAVRSGRWRSARTAPGWPPAAATTARGCSTRPAAPRSPAWTTKRR